MSVGTAPLGLPDQPGVQLSSEHEAAKDLVTELPDKVALGENREAVVDAHQGLDKAVVVDAAHKVGHEPVPDFNVDAREEKLIQVHHTRAESAKILMSKLDKSLVLPIECPTEILEHSITR